MNEEDYAAEAGGDEQPEAATVTWTALTLSTNYRHL